MQDGGFLKILKAALCNRGSAEDIALSEHDRRLVLKLAEIHRVLPLIFDMVYDSFSCDDEEYSKLRSSCKQMVMKQTLKTHSFLELYKKLSEAGVEPVVVKGIVCRSLYPNPDLRYSSDEDLLVASSEEDKVKWVFARCGLEMINPCREEGYQTSYLSDDGLHIELHRALFPTDSEYFSRWNSVIDRVLQRTGYTEVEGVRLRTLAPTDHLLYLILHAAKHLIHSGVGIRQVCDIVLFANTFGEELDWGYIFSVCEELSLGKFAAAIFALGEEYLCFDTVKARYPKEKSVIIVETEPLLEDILSAGVYGSADRGRVHSSSVTLRAAEGKSHSLASRLFPSRKAMSRQYSYVKKYPVLLPVAWTHRLLKYKEETDRKTGNTPVASLKIGKERVALLQRYGILPQNNNQK